MECIYLFILPEAVNEKKLKFRIKKKKSLNGGKHQYSVAKIHEVQSLPLSHKAWHWAIKLKAKEQKELKRNKTRYSVLPLFSSSVTSNLTFHWHSSSCIPVMSITSVLFNHFSLRVVPSSCGDSLASVHISPCFRKHILKTGRTWWNSRWKGEREAVLFWNYST